MLPSNRPVGVWTADQVQWCFGSVDETDLQVLHPSASEVLRIATYSAAWLSDRPTRRASAGGTWRGVWSTWPRCLGTRWQKCPPVIDEGNLYGGGWSESFDGSGSEYTCISYLIRATTTARSASVYSDHLIAAQGWLNQIYSQQVIGMELVVEPKGVGIRSGLKKDSWWNSRHKSLLLASVWAASFSPPKITVWNTWTAPHKQVPLPAEGEIPLLGKIIYVT